MNAESKVRTAPSINGHMIVLGICIRAPILGMATFVGSELPLWVVLRRMCVQAVHGKPRHEHVCLEADVAIVFQE